MIGLGLSAGNVERLQQGKPIHLHLEELNLPYKIDLMIMYGETEQALADSLKGFIGPDTIINRDRSAS